MRKITLEAVQAFDDGVSFKKDNTRVVVFDDDSSVSLVLHGGEIARKYSNGDLFVQTAGYPSNTTKERLNGIAGVSVNQKKGEWYLNGEKWDGSWKQIR